MLKTKHSITRERGYCSIMCVPLLDWGQGVEALFYAQSASGRFFQQREMDWLDALASKAREKLWGPEPPEPAEGDTPGRSLTDAAQEVLDTVVEVLSPERAAIFFQEPPNEELAVLASHQLPRENFLTEAPVSFALLESLWEKGEPVNIVDAQQHELADLEGIKEHGIRSVAACPLFDQENKVRGLLYLDSCQEAGLFRSRELNLLRQLGEKLANEWPAALAVHKPSEEDWSAVLDSLSKTKSNRQISGWEVLLESLARNDGEAHDVSRPTEELARPIELEAFIPRFSEPDDDNLIFEFDEAESDEELVDLPEVVPVPRVEKIKARPEPEWIEETPAAPGADPPPALELVTINKLFRGKALFQRSLRGRKGPGPRSEAGDEEVAASEELPTSEPDAYAPASEPEQPAETPLGAPTVVFGSETMRLGMAPAEGWQPAQTSWEAPSPAEQAEEWGPWVNMAMAAEPTFTSTEEQPDEESFDEALLDDYPEEFDLQAPAGEPDRPEAESPSESASAAWVDEPQPAWPVAEPVWPASDWPAEGEAAAAGPGLEPRIELEPPPEFVERAAPDLKAEPEEWAAEPEVEEAEPEEWAAEPEVEQVEAAPEEWAAEPEVGQVEAEPEEWSAEPEVEEVEPEEWSAEPDVDEIDSEAEEGAAQPEAERVEAEPEELTAEPEDDEAEPEVEQVEAEPQEWAAEAEAEPEELTTEPEAEAEPEELATEPESEAEPEELTTEPKSEAEPEELTTEPESEAEPEELTTEPEAEAEPEELTTEPEAESEPEELTIEPQAEPEAEEFAPVFQEEFGFVPDSDEMAVEADPEPPAEPNDESFEAEPEPFSGPVRTSGQNDDGWESQEPAVEMLVEETRAMAFDSMELAVEPTMEEGIRLVVPVPVAPPPTPSLFERILRWIGLKSTPEGPVPVPVRINGRVLVERPLAGRVGPTEIVLHFPQARLRMVLELEHGQTEYDFSANFSPDRVPATASLTLRKAGYHPVKLTGIRLVDGQAQVPEVTLLPEEQER
ncbi:MAG: GAF domain-containing protein [Vulcanimicrobiota bacterium]